MAAPALPDAPAEYSQSYLIGLTRILRLYFTGQVDVKDPVLTALSTIGTYTASASVGNVDGGVILVDTTAGAVTITLPAASKSKDYSFTVKRITATANGVTVTATSGNIDGGASVTIGTQYKALTFKSDGTNYWIIGAYVP